mmetsp:Transcript_5383/g.10363  ORF Transcript_5383/g.10363 Transcript_5383/m.10363 type:complete len:169 (-) Transcript_5383:2812-3318(-)
MSDDDTNNDNNSSQNAIFLKRIAGAMGASGVAMGAFGAHALKKALDQRGTAAMWQTATTYQLFHATAILSLATTAASLSSSSLPDPMSLASNKQHLMAGKLMGIGNLLFFGIDLLLGARYRSEKDPRTNHSDWWPSHDRRLGGRWNDVKQRLVYLPLTSKRMVQTVWF